MLIDLLNSENYIMINKNAVQVLGLNSAVYCSELLNIYKKAHKKNKIYEDKFFKVDRDYITKQTSLSVEDQIKCDINLLKVNIIERDAENPDLININIELYASILASEDVKLLGSVSKKVKVDNPKGTASTKKARIISGLKDAVDCNTPAVTEAMNNFIDSYMSNDSIRPLSKQQIMLFMDTLNNYCNGNLELALEIIKIATVHNYHDCQWAINVYEKNKQIKSYSAGTRVATTVRTTEQKKSAGFGQEAF